MSVSQNQADPVAGPSTLSDTPADSVVDLFFYPQEREYFDMFDQLIDCLLKEESGHKRIYYKVDAHS